MRGSCCFIVGISSSDAERLDLRLEGIFDELRVRPGVCFDFDNSRHPFTTVRSIGAGAGTVASLMKSGGGIGCEEVNDAWLDEGPDEFVFLGWGVTSFMSSPPDSKSTDPPLTDAGRDESWASSSYDAVLRAVLPGACLPALVDAFTFVAACFTGATKSDPLCVSEAITDTARLRVLRLSDALCPLLDAAPPPSASETDAWRAAARAAAALSKPSMSVSGSAAVSRPFAERPGARVDLRTELCRSETSRVVTVFRPRLRAPSWDDSIADSSSFSSSLATDDCAREEARVPRPFFALLAAGVRAVFDDVVGTTRDDGARDVRRVFRSPSEPVSRSVPVRDAGNNSSSELESDAGAGRRLVVGFLRSQQDK